MGCMNAENDPEALDTDMLPYVIRPVPDQIRSYMYESMMTSSFAERLPLPTYTLGLTVCKA